MHLAVGANDDHGARLEVLERTLGDLGAVGVEGAAERAQRAHILQPLSRAEARRGERKIGTYAQHHRVGQLGRLLVELADALGASWGVD